jgi:hypothetical protein
LEDNDLGATGAASLTKALEINTTVEEIQL